MLPDLEQLLTYENTAVTTRFCIRFPEHQDRARQIFQHMLRYLWLTQVHQYDLLATPNAQALQFRPVMHTEMRIIDEMWHDFILMTKDYAQFCEDFFGHFIHHQVNMRDELAEVEIIDEQAFYQETELFFSYVYDKLGANVLNQWFSAD